MKLEFELIERKNVHRKSKKEFALQVSFGGRDPWTVYAWEKAPTTQQLDMCMEITYRAMEVYHKHLVWPKFNLEPLVDSHLNIKER